MASVLRSFFRRSQLPQADAEAADKALKTELDVPVVRVVRSSETDAAPGARSASGSSHDLETKGAGSLAPRLQSEAAALADEISLLTHAPVPRGTPAGLACAARQCTAAPRFAYRRCCSASPAAVC